MDKTYCSVKFKMDVFFGVTALGNADDKQQFRSWMVVAMATGKVQFLTAARTAYTM